MTTGPLRLGAGFLVFTHRAFQGNAIWGEGDFVLASTRIDVFLALSKYHSHNFPGTGKTQFPRYLVEPFDRDLIKCRASYLFSMWVVGTEKVTVLAFREAEVAEGIFLLDEVG